MTKRRANPQTEKLFTLALLYRAAQVDLHKLERIAMKHYAGECSGNPSRRSMLKRLFCAPDDCFARATRAYMAHKDMHAIVKLVPKLSAKT